MFSREFEFHIIKSSPSPLAVDNYEIIQDSQETSSPETDHLIYFSLAFPCHDNDPIITNTYLLAEILPWSDMTNKSNEP